MNTSEQILKILKIDFDTVKDLIENKCYLRPELSKHYNFENNSKFKRAFTNFINIYNIKVYSNVSNIQSRIIIRYEEYIKEWWNHDLLREAILYKLTNNLIINYADKDRKVGRYVIAVKNHPRASSSNQVKAHILLWELHNKKSFPDNHILVPKDNNFMNLNIDNFDIYTNEDYRSIVATGKRNHFYTNGSQSGVCYKGGWKSISKKFLKDNICIMCGENNKYLLNSHHIISYYLFDKPKDAHFEDNLICLCDSCHTKVHQNNLSLLGYVSEKRRLNLLELLEKLKETIIDERKLLWDFSFKSISSQDSELISE